MMRNRQGWWDGVKGVVVSLAVVVLGYQIVKPPLHPWLAGTPGAALERAATSMGPTPGSEPAGLSLIATEPHARLGPDAFHLECAVAEGRTESCTYH